MKITNIEDYERGWFVGNFLPSTVKTESCEVAYKTYKKGQHEASHYHSIATEVTLIVHGKALFNFVKLQEIHQLSAGDIILIEPNEIVEFSAIEDTETICIKLPSVLGDKYLD